ncbi:MAG: dienelactone hydrolase family protein [Planctomycetes bacterium]|nr:dienelactone hydrolase family protein [Planctomycetota bacterium]
MNPKTMEKSQLVRIPSQGAVLEGDLDIPSGAGQVILFAHGSGSSRFSPRNRFVAQELRKAGFATLLADLLSPEEEQIDSRTAHLRFDIGFLARRLISVTDWLRENETTSNFKIGYFGASTGAAAALVSAVKRREAVGAIVSRGGRPDLAEEALPLVRAPTLLIVGGNDFEVIEMNRAALDLLESKKELVIVPGATHLFEEPGALEEVARLASGWFTRYLSKKRINE